MARKTYYQRPDGLYEAIRVINGKRKAFRGHTPREVEQKMIDYQGEVERGKLFKEIADEWEKRHYPTLSPTTVKGYKPACKRAVDCFGNTPIKQIAAPMVKRFIDSFAHNGPKQIPRGKKTVTNQLLVVSLIMGYAVEIGEIPFNPCLHLPRPSAAKRVRREAASTEDEAKIKANPKEWFFPYLVLYTGLRCGEALALTYGDIDQNAGVIHVTKSVYYSDNNPRLKSPKSSAGVRDVPILDPLKPYLPKSKDRSLYLFSEDGGVTPLREHKFQQLWREYSERIGITCTPHQLRHSYATMLFECGVDVKDAQDLLGHSTAAMTQDVYTHIRNARRKQTAQLINEKLGKIT